MCQGGVVHRQLNAARGNVDLDWVAFLHQCDGALFGGFGRHMPDGEPRGAAREAPVRQQRAGLSEAFGFEVAGRVQHLLHARSAAGAFVANYQYVAGADLVAQYCLYRCILAFENARRASKAQDAGVNPGGFHDATFLGNVAEQDGQPAVFAIGVFQAADATIGAVIVHTGVARRLAERGLGRDARGPGLKKKLHLGIGAAHQVPLRQRLAQTGAVDCGHVSVQQLGPLQLTEDTHHAAGPVHVFHVVVGGGRRHFAQVRHLPRQPVDVRHVEIDFPFLRSRQQVQHGIGRTAHGDVKAHGVFERLE